MDIPARRGGMLLLNWLGIWPFSTLDALTLTIAAVLLVLGVVIQVVELGEFLRLKAIARNDTNRAKTAAEAQLKADYSEAIENLVTLDEMELRQLLWILRSGHQRTSQHVEHELVQKKIIRQPDPYVRLYIVADPIWGMRDELLKKYASVREEREFPHYNVW